MAVGATYNCGKRVFDLAFVLVLACPALLIVSLCAALIGAESRGPVLFRQRRIGREGREFTCVKLRTMYADTDNLPSHEVSSRAVTGVGRFLRRHKLDELPQLWNVLRGDMSLVGPRPCLPSQLELIEARRARGVLSLLPGITGFSQVRGIDMSQPTKLAALDACYVPNLGSDLRILTATLLGAGRGDRIQS